MERKRLNEWNNVKEWNGPEWNRWNSGVKRQNEKEERRVEHGGTVERKRMNEWNDMWKIRKDRSGGYGIVEWNDGEREGRMMKEWNMVEQWSEREHKRWKKW